MINLNRKNCLVNILYNGIKKSKMHPQKYHLL